MNGNPYSKTGNIFSGNWMVPDFVYRNVSHHSLPRGIYYGKIYAKNLVSNESSPQFTIYKLMGRRNE